MLIIKKLNSKTLMQSFFFFIYLPFCFAFRWYILKPINKFINIVSLHVENRNKKEKESLAEYNNQNQNQTIFWRGFQDPFFYHQFSVGKNILNMGVKYYWMLINEEVKQMKRYVLRIQKVQLGFVVQKKLPILQESWKFLSSYCWNFGLKFLVRKKCVRNVELLKFATF